MEDFFNGCVAGFIIGTIAGVFIGSVIWFDSGKPTTPATAWQVYLETQDEWTKKMDEAMGVKE